MKKQDSFRYIPVEERNGIDPRFLGSQGRYSRQREVIITALEAYGKQGATLDEVVELVGKDLPGYNPNMSAGKTLHSMLDAGYVMMVNGKWYMKESAPTRRPDSAPAAQNGHIQPIAPFAQKRSGKTITLYTTPETLENVIGLSLLHKEQWYKMPLFDNVRLCIGMEAPQWSPEQEMYSDITEMKVLFKNGQTVNRAVNPREIVTIAPEE